MKSPCGKNTGRFYHEAEWLVAAITLPMLISGVLVVIQNNSLKAATKESAMSKLSEHLSEIARPSTISARGTLGTVSNGKARGPIQANVQPTPLPRPWNAIDCER
jgi:hypothetical protein